MLRRWIGLPLSFYLLLTFGAGLAVGEDAERSPSFDLPTKEPVLEYRLVIGQLQVEDNAQWVKVFHDGRVSVHIPAFKRGGGDYTLQMTPGEVEELVRFSLEQGVATFDSSKVKEQKSEVIRRFRDGQRARPEVGVDATEAPADSGTEARGEREQDPGLRAVFDAPTTVLEVHLEEYRPGPAKGSLGGALDRRIQWYALQWDAEWFPEVEALTQLAEVEQRLRGFLKRPDLVPVEGGTR